MPGKFISGSIKSRSKKSTNSKRRRPAIERLEDKNLLAADLSLNVTDNGATAGAGETVVYEFEYANIGDEAAEGTLQARLSHGATINAEESDAAWECEETTRGDYCELELGELAADAAGTVTLAATVDESIADYQREIYVSGRISGDDIRRDRNDGDWAVTPIDRPVYDLNVSIDDGDATIMPGETVAYTVDFANNGTTDATDASISVRIPRDTSLDTEASSEGWTCDGRTCTYSVGDVAASDSGSAVIAVTLDAESNARFLSTSANIEADGIDANRRDNSDSDSTEVAQMAPDLSITINDGDVGAVAAGETIVYGFTYANTGAADSSAAVINFAIPYGTTVAEDTGDWNCDERTCTLEVGDVAVDASGEATLAVVVDADLSDRVKSIYSRVRISDDGTAGYDANYRDNYDRIATEISRTLPDVGVSISDGDAVVSQGDTVSYTIDYSNDGNVDSMGVEVRVYLGGATALAEGTDWECDGGNCSVLIGDLAAGATGTLTLNATVDSSNRVRAFAQIGDDGENGRDANRRNNRDYVRTSVVEVELEEEEEESGEATGEGESGEGSEGTPA